MDRRSGVPGPRLGRVLERRLELSRRLADRGLLQHEIVAHEIERRGQRLAGRRLAAGQLFEIDDQWLLHRIDDVAVEVAIPALEQVRDDAVIARRLDREMNVRRPVMADGVTSTNDVTSDVTSFRN